MTPLSFRHGLAYGAVAVAAMVCACGTSDTQSSSSGAGGLITGAGGDSTSNGSGGMNASSSSSSTAATGGEGGDGSGGEGTGGAGGTPICVDIGQGEPNETEANAFELAGQSDCAAASTISGVIAGAEEDWFKYAGNDALCVVNPERVFSQQGGLLLCKYFECQDNSANTVIACPSGTMSDTSNGARPGCCSASSFTVSDVNCTGTIDDDTTVYLRVRAATPTAATCVDYSIAYNY